MGQVKATQIAVGNGRYHEGGVVVHEAAASDDGLLHLYALEPHSHSAEGRFGGPCAGLTSSKPSSRSAAGGGAPVLLP
jgi:hypothetical protein